MSLIGTLYSWQYKCRQWLVGMVWRWRGSEGDRAYQPEEPRRALVVLCGLIGDTVMSSVVLTEARRLWPRARLTVLGNRSTRELLGACPLIDECQETPAVPFTLRNGRGVAELRRWLEEQRFDIAIILLGDQFASILAEAKIPVRVGVRGTLLEPCLTASYSIKSPREWGPREKLGALQTLGYEVHDASPQLWVGSESKITARRRLSELGLPDGASYAVVHPFGSTRRQWWPLDRVEPLARRMLSDHGLRTIVIGGPETKGQFQKAEDSYAIDATGAFNIPELLAVIDDAARVITTDSGPFHIAGALGRPLIGMFRDRHRTHAARYPRTAVVFGKDDVCEGQCAWDRCRSIPCRQMMALSVEEVLATIAGTTESQSCHARSEMGLPGGPPS